MAKTANATRRAPRAALVIGDTAEITIPRILPSSAGPSALAAAGRRFDPSRQG
jgi:hypothetical protein